MGEKESDCVASRCVLSPAACSLNECGAFVFLPILECLGAVCVTSKLHYHGPRNTAVRCGAVGPGSNPMGCGASQPKASQPVTSNQVR